MKTRFSVTIYGGERIYYDVYQAENMDQLHKDLMKAFPGCAVEIKPAPVCYAAAYNARALISVDRVIFNRH